MSVTGHSPTLGELVLEQPDAAALFERLGIDYCCDGRRTLEEACRERGLDARTVGALLASPPDEPPGAVPEAHDVANMSIAELCDHIVADHHRPLRRELTRITELLARVVRVHGADRPDLEALQRRFAATRSELEEHLAVEEQRLFPACRELDANASAGALDPELLHLLEDDHAATGAALRSLRELAGDYRLDAALCATHRALLQALHAFELDLHHHVHEENNVLFGRVRERAAAG